MFCFVIPIFILHKVSFRHLNSFKTTLLNPSSLTCSSNVRCVDILVSSSNYLCHIIIFYFISNLLLFSFLFHSTLFTLSTCQFPALNKPSLTLIHLHNPKNSLADYSPKYTQQLFFKSSLINKNQKNEREENQTVNSINHS